MDYFGGLSIALAGLDRHNSSRHRNQPRYYGVQYNHSGRMQLRINRKTVYRVEGAWAFITYPGTYFEYGPIEGNPRSHNYVCFHGPRVQEYIRTGLLPIAGDNPLIKINRPGRFLATLREISEGLAARVPSADRLTHTLEDLLLQLHEQEGYHCGTPSYHDPAFSELIDGINREPQHGWDFAAEATRLNMSLAHFRRLFRKLAGESPQHYLIQRRMHRAAQDLTETADLVSQISRNVGIDNEFYFSRLFKKTYALSPLEYRKEFASHR